MKRNAFLVERSTTKSLSNWIEIVEGPYKLNNTDINTSGTMVRESLSVRVTFVKELNFENESELRKQMQQLANEKGIGCKGLFENKWLMCLPQRKDKMGIWKEGDAIYHQMKPFGRVSNGCVVIKDKEEDSNSNSNENSSSEENSSSTFETYFSSIFSSLAQFPFSPCVRDRVAFLLAYNKFLSRTAPSNSIYLIEIKDNKFCGNQEVIFTSEQFAYYVEPCLKGEIPPHWLLYSTVCGTSLNELYENWEKELEQETEEWGMRTQNFIF